MIPTIIIVVLIIVYGGWVIRKKVRDIRNGKFCSCGCEGCSGSCGKKITGKEPE